MGKDANTIPPARIYQIKRLLLKKRRRRAVLYQMLRIIMSSTAALVVVGTPVSRASQFKLEKSIDIATVPAGLPVEFCLLTDGPRQYVAYYDHQRRMTIAMRTVDSDTWQSKVLPTQVGWDSHNDITMAINCDAHLHVSGNMHAVKLINFRTENPGDITILKQFPMTGKLESRTTYPRFLTDQQLHKIIKKADIVSPWTVGRFSSPASASKHAESWVKPDIAWTEKNHLDYLPVAFLGFSWHNLRKSQGLNKKHDQIPRLKGEFLWSQAIAYKKAGAEMLDEVDEGTAIFKCTNTPPVGDSPFLTYEGLPTDHYLWLTGKAGELMRNRFPATWKMPTRSPANRPGSGAPPSSARKLLSTPNR